MIDDRVREARDESKQWVEVEYRDYLRSVCSTVKSFLDTLPYRSNKRLLHNIYLSCLFSLLKTMTLSVKNKKRISEWKSRGRSIDRLIDKIYEIESQDRIVLWHLEPSYYNYISTLVRKLKKEIAVDLNYISSSYEPSEDIIRALLMSPLEDINNFKNHEGLK